ncbi:MAG: L-rhamnonate dehydratase [Dehalococcoidia bacterium]|nr:L-rhamnonate dehydratase [Dehalococcoidia bacterium]
MKIKSIYSVAWDAPEARGFFGKVPVEPKTKPRRPSWIESGPVANPVTRYPRYSAYRPLWTPTWGDFIVVAEAEDGTKGFAFANHGKPVAAMVDEYFGLRLAGENAMAIEKCYDMMVRMCAPFGATGIASYAVSGIDLALWDLKGKLLDRPVYELLGGPSKDELFCYSTGGDTDWYMELGFKATKLPCPFAMADGLDGLKKNVELVAKTREMVGDGVELMLDCWMAFDTEYAVRLAEELRPYKLKWMEECLRSEDFDAHAQLRQRAPWQTLATGEHWFTTYPFQHAASRHIVDILQPDIQWVGGLTPIVKICAIAEATSMTVIPHGGGNTPYGQHACYALPVIPWTECFVPTPPGVPPSEAPRLPGMAMPKNGRMIPSDAPGFGIDMDVGKLPRFFR